MPTLDLIGRAILMVDAAALILSAGWTWREGRSTGGSLSRKSAFFASLGLGVAAAIVVYGLTR
jgi:hypothetical protein